MEKRVVNGKQSANGKLLDGQDEPDRIFKEMPTDRFFFVKITVFVIGMTSLLPWNLFITANEYWMYKLRNISSNSSSVDDEKTDLQTNFTSFLVITSNVPFCIFLLVNTLIAHRFSPTKRIVWSLGLTVILFAGTAGVVYVDTDHHQMYFVVGTLLSVVVINIVGSFLKGAGTGVAGFLPTNYMKSYVYGQAMGGVFVSVAQILSLLSSSSAQASALAYFLCAAVTIAATFVLFIFMVKTDFYQFYFASQIGKKCQDLQSKDVKQVKVPILELGLQVWPYELATVITFGVTLSIFPAVTVLVKSASHTGNAIESTFFLPVYCFLIFNVSDIVGRVIAAFVLLPGKKGYVELTCSVLRLGFVPLFLLCNGHPRYLLPVVFNHDAYYAVFVALFAMTNGYVYAVVMAKAPNIVETQYKETVSSLLALFLGLGIMIGSFASFGTIHLL